MRKLVCASMRVNNLEISKGFYKKLGFQIHDIDATNCMFDYNDGESIISIYTIGTGMRYQQVGSGIGFYFATSRMPDDLRNKFIANGINATGPVTESSFGVAFSIIDPDGYELHFLNEERKIIEN